MSVTRRGDGDYIRGEESALNRSRDNSSKEELGTYFMGLQESCLPSRFSLCNLLKPSVWL